MTKKSNSDILEKLLAVSIALLGLYAIRSLLKDDSGDIVSDQGKSVLNDDEKMKKIDALIEESKKHSEEESHNSIYVS